jgi:uncharacterized protein
MVSRQDATLNLSSLLAHAPGDAPEVAGEGLVAPSDAQLDEAGLRLAGPLHWNVVVRSTGGDDDFIAEGEVGGTAVMECRRCLREVETSVTADFLYPMVYRPGTGGLRLIEAPLDGDAPDVDPLDDPGEDRLAFGTPDVDFAPLLLQVFAIDLPLTVLCKESCRGLSLDGVDLNEFPDHVPEGSTAPSDDDASSPFAVLEDLDLDSRP